MKTWQEDLAERIASVRSSKWWGRLPPEGDPHTFHVETFLNPADGFGYHATVAPFECEVGDADISCVVGLMNQVNRDAFAGAGPETLLIVGHYKAREGPTRLTFLLRSRPWNHFLNLDGEWVEYVDAKGSKPYATADFSAIP